MWLRRPEKVVALVALAYIAMQASPRMKAIRC